MSETERAASGRCKQGEEEGRMRDSIMNRCEGREGERGREEKKKRSE